jgi:hypothetical protein
MPTSDHASGYEFSITKTQFELRALRLVTCSSIPDIKYLLINEIENNILGEFVYFANNRQIFAFLLANLLKAQGKTMLICLSLLCSRVF